MRLQLDDNQRGAVHYLLGGVLLVAAVRGLAWAVEALGPAYGPEGLTLRPFQQGYLGYRNELAVVGTTAGLSERMVLASVASVVVAVVVAAGCALLLRNRRTAGMWITRGALAATLAWALYAALLLPLRESRIEDGVLVITQRRHLVGDVPLPFTAHETRYARPGVARIHVREAVPVRGCDGRVLLELFPAGQEQGIPLAAEAGVCPDERLARLRNGSEAAALLERELR